jgi:gliding motility-associated-like protein
MKNILATFIICSFLSNGLMAQDVLVTKLFAHYTFDDCKNLGKDSGEKNLKANLSPSPPSCVCGVEGGAMKLNGDEYMILTDLSYRLGNSNFSISFYLKPLGSVGTREFISNKLEKDSCNRKRAFVVAYNAAARGIVVNMRDEKRSITLNGRIDNDACWQHIVITREGNFQTLWINGKRRDAKYTSDNQRINLSTNSLLSIGSSDCNPKVLGGQFRGLIDDFRYFDNVGLREVEIESLYKRADRIKNEDQLLFIGNQIQTDVENTCANRFAWQPTTGVLNPNSSQTIIKPESPGIYKYVLRFGDTVSTCTSYDTLRLTVVDPKTQPCGDVYMPNAFTPNSDNTNETFGISNPYTISELLEFEILDRWGGRIFKTTDAFVQWDGTIGGTKAMPGQYLYRIRYKCEGNEKSKIGSFILLQ